MNTYQEILMTDLRSLIAELGTDGGQMSPSIYDTAQVLRFAPPPEGIHPALDWLKSQQQADGGWGEMGISLPRHIPTLAAILALQIYAKDWETREMIQDGLFFLQQNAHEWQPPLPEELPVGAELIIPTLLCEAGILGLDIDPLPYRALIELGKKKRAVINKIQPKAGTAPVFSWEAWGMQPDLDVIDGTGGVGHNPAATAYWIHLATDQEHLKDKVEAAYEYLEKSSASTGLDIPGVMPTAWPITRFEQAFVLHTLQMAGLLDEPILDDVLSTKINTLALSLQPLGLGFSDYFAPDGDDTLAAVAVLKGSGYAVPEKPMRFFQNGTHFVAYQGEMQPAPSVTARGLHALSMWNETMPTAEEFIIERQQRDGRWLGDKWNSSWYYTTYLSLFALSQHNGNGRYRYQNVGNTICKSQNHDGGWSTDGFSNFTETAYAMLALNMVNDSKFDNCMKGGYRWMLENYSPFAKKDILCWLNKQSYRADRIDRAFELSAMLTAGKRFSPT
jgi:hypothetical protein